MASTPSRAAAMVTAAATATVFLSSCGGSSGTGNAAHSTTSAESAEVATHNGEDVVFAQNMIPRQERAIDMAGLAQTNTTNAAVIALASQITAVQLPDVQAFKAWLVQWQQPEPGAPDESVVDRLKPLRGPEFDKAWLQWMVTDHRGVIAMAQREVAHGQNQDVVSMANSTIATQQGEIDKMTQLLGG